jgi:2-iminobutanoate/2-iminopropanoate deaminase
MSSKRIFLTSRLPKPKGPYSQAVRAGDLLFLSGMLGINPETGETAPDVAGQTDQALKNISLLVEEAGGGLADVVKTTVFLAKTEYFAAMNEVYARYFPADPPARSTLQASPPGGFLVEIEAIAYLPQGD